MEHDPCPVCNGPVARRLKERPSEWRARKSCSPECKRELNSIGLLKDPASRGDHPPCPICHGPVPRYPGEQRSKWLVRQTCGRACRTKLRAREPRVTNRAYTDRRRAAALDYDHPPCVVCKGPVEVRAGEAPYNWRDRQTCSRTCLAKLRERARGEYGPRSSARTDANPGWRWNKLPAAKRQKRHRAAHFETVDEALARGVAIQQCPPAYAAPVAGAEIVGNRRVA